MEEKNDKSDEKDSRKDDESQSKSGSSSGNESEEDEEEEEEEDDDKEESEKDNKSNKSEENNNKKEIKKDESYSSFGIKPVQNEKNNSKKILEKSDSEDEEKSENKKIEKEEKEEENNKNNDSEKEIDKEEKSEEKYKNRKEESDDDDDEDSISDERKNELKIKKINVNHYKYEDAKTLKSLFAGKITEESIITENDDDILKTNGCNPNEMAIIFLKILLNQKEDLNIIFNRQKYQSLINSIKENKNYLEIYKDILNTGEYKNLYEQLKTNKHLIMKPILLVTINPNEQIEVEFYKYGKTFTSSIRKRFGIIMDNRFYSSKQSLNKFDSKKAKDKTKYILNSKEIMRENYDGNENNYDKKKNIWHNEEKVYRIKINYLTDKYKESSFFIYCEDERERNEIYQLIKLTQMKLNIKEPANNALKKLQKTIKRNNVFYAMLKIMAVKNKIKNKERIRKYFNYNILGKDKKKLNEFAYEISNKIKMKFIQQKKFFYNKGINRYMKHLILNSKFIKNKEENKINESKNIDNITKAVNKIYDILKKPYYNINTKRINNIISFPVKDINRNNEKSKAIKLDFNYKNICINSIDNNKTYLNKSEIFDITNVIYNFCFNGKMNDEDSNIENSKKQYNILILGPYINPGNNYNENNIYFDIKIPKNKYMKNAYDKLIYNTNLKIDYLVFQIFNCEINKSEIKNFNLASSITERDFFFLKIIGGRNNNYSMQTKLYNPKRINEHLIILEFNNEMNINREFFCNKNEEIKVILYHIHKLSLNEINLMDTILLDYINKNEIKVLYFNLNMIKNRTYEATFDQCKKSKLFWNIIPFYQNKICFSSNEKNYGYKASPFFSKDLKIGNLFYYLEKTNQEKISSLINNKDIPSYYKYEKIERYIQNINYYHLKLQQNNKITNNPSNILNFNKDNINKEINYEEIKETKGGILNLCEYLGINDNEEIFFHNLFTNEYKWRKFDKNKFIVIQNNSFNIINNKEMYNFNKDTNEKFIYSFQWYKILSFQNEIQMLSFIEILKKLRRLSNSNFFNTKNIIAQEINPREKIPDNEIIYGLKINEDLLYDILKEDEESKNNINIIISLNKIELKNDFNMNYNTYINLEIVSRTAELDIKNEINLFEIFLNNMKKYNNKIITSNSKINSLKINKRDKNENYKICFKNTIELNKNYFDKNNNKIIYTDLLPEKERLMDLNIDLTKDNIIQINLNCLDEDSEQNMYSYFDINKDIFNSFLIKKIIHENVNNGNYNYNNIFADFLILPLYLNSQDNNLVNDNIVGILTFQFICINKNNNTINDIDINSYNYIYNKLISDYIYLCFKKGINMNENGYYNNIIANNDSNEKIKENELINILGTFEPNVFKNVILYKIYKCFGLSLLELLNQNDFGKISNYNNLKGIIDQEYIANLNDYNSRYLFNKFSKYLYKYKRNNFYYYFTETSWINLLINLSKNNNIEVLNDIYYNFPTKEKLISLFKRNSPKFFNIRDLMYMGLPNDISRKIIWDKLLNINNLVDMTCNKLTTLKIYYFTSETSTMSSIPNKNEYNKEKGEIYTLLNDITKNNFLEEYFSIMDTIIDLDIMNLKEISNNDYNNFEIIKQITKTFYQWTLLNIGSTSEANAVNKVSEIKDMDGTNFFPFYNQSNLYCYYSGIIYLSDKLFKYFKSPSETFWYLVGLSQVIPMFNIKYNSYELSIYILVIKLILEQHHINLYNKLLSLNFPFEYFISKHIASYYSSFFYDVDLFMKISDILIFESSIAINNNLDSINHLRFLCSIALTILVENESKFLSVDNIFQLENLFKVLKFKTYNIQKFFKQIYESINRYFIDVNYKYAQNNEKNNLYSIINKKWDKKRSKIEKILDDNYYSYTRNNYKYMEKKFKDLSLVIHNNYIPLDNKEENKQNQYNLNDNTNRININIWKYIIRTYLEKHEEENKNNQKNVISRGLLIILREIKILNFDKNNNFNLIGKYSFDCFVEKGNINKINNKIIINEKGQIFNIMNNFECFINYKYYYKDSNILIFSLATEKNEVLFQFKLNLNNINLLKPIRLEIHSNKSYINSNIAILEISVLKYNDFILNNDYCHLYLSLFSPSDYKIDNVINKKFLEINDFPKIQLLLEENETDEENICNFIYTNYHEKLPLIYQFYLDKYFLNDNKSFNEKIKEETILEIKKIISELFVFKEKENYFIEDIVKWFKEKKDKYNNITIMEILIYLYLDNNIMNQNGNDILYNLFCFSSLNNKKNIVSISSVIELIYCLYKKYCIYYQYNDVKKMVNYFFQKEKYPSIKNVIIFNSQEINKIKEIISNKNRYEIKNKINNINNRINYIDITDDFFYIMNNFEEICKICGIYNNRLDLNPQSKNNVILILKIILSRLFLNDHNENNNLDYQLYNFIVIDYLKEYTNEEFYFSFQLNTEKNLFDVLLIDDDKKYSNKNNNNFFYNSEQTINIYESILFYANNNFLFNNINNDYIEYDISFYEFKKLFFSLPYLNDLLWKNCYKLSSTKKNINHDNLIRYKSISNKNILYERVNINIINNEKKIVQFIFVSNIQSNKNLNYSSNFSHSFNSIIINYNVYSNFIIKKLYDIINNKIQYQDLKKYSTKDNNFVNDIQLIRDSLSDFNNLLFYSINNTYHYNYSINHYNDYLDNNNKYHFLEPLLPLYINFNFSELKNNSINFNIDITYSFWKKNNNIIKNKGYAKFPLNSQIEFYQWRKCLMKCEKNKNEEKIYKIKFDCFNKLNKNEKKMIKLFCSHKKENNIIDNENNDNADDIISFSEQKNIGKNILINRNNDYKCL